MWEGKIDYPQRVFVAKNLAAIFLTPKSCVVSSGGEGDSNTGCRF